MSRKKREELDEKVSRILLFILGSAFLAFGVFVYYTNTPIILNSVPFYFFLGFCLLGLPLLFISLFGKKSTAVKWAENTGNHEVLIVFILLSYGIASLTKSKNT